MSFKKLPLFLMSAVLLSGCTKGCESSKPAPTPAPAAPKSEAAVEQTQSNVAATAEDAEADNE